MKAKITPMIWIIIDSSDTAYTTGTLGTATSTVAYGYNSTYWRDQLTSYNGTTITYDAVGNPLKWRDGMSFTWMAGRQMYTTTMSNGNKYYYEYNDDGIRYKKWKSGGLVTNYYLDGSTIIAEKNSQNTIIYKHDENGKYVGFNLNGTDYYYVYNVQGDVMGIVNASGAIVARYTYDPWGKVLAVRNVAGAIVTSSTHVGNINPIRYRGYYYDAETGLYYLQSRYYDPTVGRFVNADAYVQTGTGIMDKNMYAYCLDDPVNYLDSEGAFVFGVGITLQGGAVFGGSVAALFVFDTSGNCGILIIPTVVTCTPQASAAVSAMISWCDTIYDLEGISYSAGGSGDLGASIGADFLFDDNGMNGLTVNLGAGIAIPFDAHAGMSAGLLIADWGERKTENNTASQSFSQPSKTTTYKPSSPKQQYKPAKTVYKTSFNLSNIPILSC